MASTRRPRGEETRLALLEAGVALLDELTIDELLVGLRTRRVAARAGTTTGAFFHHWPDHASYVSDLATHVVADHPTSERQTLIADSEQLGGAPEPVALQLELCRRAFDTSGTHLDRHLLLWSRCADPSLRTVVRDRYRAHEELLRPLYRHNLERWHRELRPPFTEEHLVTLVTALRQGLQLRAFSDPDRVPADLFGWATVALLPTITRLVGDPTDFFGRVGEINDFPAQARLREQQRPDGDHWRARAARTKREATRATVLAAARSLYRTSTRRRVTVRGVAARAGVSPRTVYEHFGSLTGVVGALWTDDLVPPLRASIERDLAADVPALDALHAHLVRLADVASEHLGLTAALADVAHRSALAEPEGQTPSEALLDFFAVPMLALPLLERGRDQGVVDASLDLVDVAATATWILLLRVVALPDVSTRRTVDFVEHLVLHGIATDAATGGAA